MTSPANQQNTIPATNSSATTASYASAAGAPKQPAQAPVIATGSQAPVVVGSSASPAQNANRTSTSPVNGKPSVTPAVPAVARGSAPNGSLNHSRKSSVTMAANGPNSYVANGGPVGGVKPGIQFGFESSPAPTHSTPQTGASAPIPIPGGNSGSVPSPAASPAPIPQPSASGGPPRSGLQQPGGSMLFGSLGSDGERHMRQGSAPPNPNAMGQPQPHGTHFRRESGHSVSGESQGRGGGFIPQGGRGGRGYNPQYNNQMGYPPNNQFRNGPGQGRGMPPAFQPQSRNMGYPSSPQPSRVQPTGSMPGTPNMPQANMQPGMAMQTPPQYHYPPPPMGPQQNFGYPPQHDSYGRPLSMQYGAYGQMPYMAGPPQANSPSFNQQFAQPAYHQASHSMSRTPSQPERPSSANQPNQPMVVSSTPQPQNAQPKPTTSSFVKPRKSAAIQIKNLAGEVVDTSSFKAPASPAPSTTKTPPVTTSTPTPPPKTSTPSHGRAESQQPTKTAKEIQEELRNKIKAATAEAAEDSSAERKGPATEAKAAEPKPAPEPAAASTQAPAAPVVTPAEAPKEAPKEPEAAPKKEEENTKAEAEKPAETEEEEMERMIREMEEEDARREAEAEEFNKKKAAAKAAQKAEEEKNRAAKAAEEDAKLREQEREMERLEEEKERKRNEGGKTLSVAEALAAARAGKDVSVADATKVDEVTDKLADMKIDGDKSAADAKQTTAEKRGIKPQRLDLAPLNTKPVEPPQPSAALQSLKSARFLTVMNQDMYPAGISSPNPALNAAVAKKGKTFHYDANFLLQFQKVFTEKPSVEFDQQIKSLMGDGEGGRAGSARAQTPGSAREKSGRGGGFQMGSFINTTLGGRTIPAGTTSSQRFAMSNSSGSVGRSGVNPIASFQRPGGAFPNPAGMSRTPSQSGLPSSPRTSSQRTRGGSRRNNFDAKEAQAAKTMPLTAGQEVKPIAVTSSGWKPTSIGSKAPAAAGAGGYMEPEMVQRKVKAALNKMTPEKFDRIADQILEIASQSKDESDGRTLRQVIQLTFEKATDEAHWASMYAKFCKRMLETISPEVRDEGIKDKNGQVVSGGNLFRKYLLNRCQEEFENGWVSKKDDGEAAEGDADKPEAEKEGEKRLGDTTLMSDEYYAAAAQKRRGLGLVQFIGELFKLGMLTERIMHQCVQRLVDYKGVPDEAEIESLCKLLRTIGYNLDQSERGAGMMNVYFTRIQQAIDMPELPSRMKFMLMDVVDLRRAGWQSKDGNKGPKTLDEVRAEAEAAQAAKAQENARSNQRGGGRPTAGRGDARNFSAGYQQQSNNQVGLDDLRRLKGSASRTSSQNVTLGPTSMFSSRSNSGRRMGPGGSLGRPGEESGASSRTGTPPTRENTSRSNTFGLLATMGDEDPTSPPSTAASPAVSKAVPADSDKKGGE